jgi:hypothetical protein
MNIVISSLFFLIMVYLISLIWTNTHGAPWVPTSREVINIMLTMAEIKPGEIVYDLGSGDGRVLIAAVRRLSGVTFSKLTCQRRTLSSPICFRTLMIA